MMLMMGEVDEQELQDAFAEQAPALADGGADALVIETMSDPAEARLASARRKSTGLPVVACMVFDSGAITDRTMMGTTPEQAAEGLGEAGADVVGSNCGQGIEGFVGICRRLRAATDLPMWIKANAGLPEMVDGQTVYRTTPAEFAAFGPALVEAGADFLGGCCGTCPEFIRALAEKIRRMNSRERVLCALRHQQPDRVPIDLGGTRQSGIAASTYHRLKQQLGIDYAHAGVRPVPDAGRGRTPGDGAVRGRRGRAQSTRPWPSGFATKTGSRGTLFDGTPVEVPGGFQPGDGADTGDLLILRDGEPIAKMPKDGFYFDRTRQVSRAPPMSIPDTLRAAAA